jgi:hypothetical protein
METKRLRTFIDTYEQHVQDLNKKILQEEENIKRANSAISNLQDIILPVEVMLHTQEENLSTLRKAIEKFEQMDLNRGILTEDEPEASSI